MHLPNILGLIAAASFISTAAAGCYQTGAKWSEAGGKDAAIGSLPVVCKALRGTYKKGEEFSYCVQPEKGRRFDFRIKYIGDDGYRNISQRECEDGLVKEIKNCARGGNKSYGNWRYM